MTETTTEPIIETPPVRRSSTRNILTVMSGTLASRVLGLLRQALFNRLFNSEITDAFNLAYRIPNLFRELLAEGALTNSIIPVYKSLPLEERPKFAASLTGALAGLNLLVVGFGILLAPFVVGLRMADHSSINFALALQLTRIVWPFLAGISFSALAMALLNASEHFGSSSFSPLAFSVVSIIGFLLFPNNAVMLAVMTVIGGFAQFFVQIPSLQKFGLMPKLEFSWHPALGKALGLMVPFTFTTGTRELLSVVLTGILTSFPIGAMTGFTNADTVFLLALGLFAVSPALAFYPRLAEYSSANDWGSFRDTLLSASRLVVFLTAPVTAVIFVLAPSVTSAMFELTGRISNDKFVFTVAALPPLALAMIPWGLNQFLVRAFYVRQKTREAIVINVAGFLLNTAMYYVLSRGAPTALAFKGVSPAQAQILLNDALAHYQRMNYGTTLTGCLIVIVYLVTLSAQVQLNWKKLVGHIIKVSIAALAAALVANSISSLIPLHRGFINGALHLGLAGGAALAVYIGLCTVLQVQEVAGLRRRFLKR